MNGAPWPSLSVAIPTVDRPRTLARTVALLAGQDDPAFTLLIVDQSAVEPPELPAWRAAWGDRLVYRRLARRSLPYARNVALTLAATDAVCFLDDDIEPDPGLVRAHRRALAAPGVAGVAGRITGGYDRDEYGGRVVGRFSRWYPKAVRNFHTDRPGEVEHAPGGNHALWRWAFAAAGGFDERFGGRASIGEESDFFLRLRPVLAESRTRLVFCPDAHLKHLHETEGGCREPDFTDWVYWHAHNQALLFARYWPRRWRLPFVAFRLLRSAAFALRRGRPGLPAAAWRGLQDGARCFRRFGHAPLNTAGGEG